jgi:hypothetical protein
MYDGETVQKHMLFDCNNLNNLRAQLLPPSPNISNTLYSSASKLRNTCSYYIMAMG